MKKIRAFFEKIYLPNWLVILLFVSLILRIPSFFEPYYYGDEMIYLTLGHGIRQGVPLYSGLYDNKPPILYLIAALAGNLVWFKILLAVAATISAVFFAKIVECLFTNNTKIQKIATIVFTLLITLPLLEGNTANAENFMMAFSLPALYLLLANKLKPKGLLFSGFLFGVSCLTKVPAFFDLPVIIIAWLISRNLKFKNVFYILVGFLFPILLTLIWFWAKGSLADYVKAAFLQNIGYLSSWRPDAVQKSFIAKNFPLLIRAFFVSVGCLTLFNYRRKLSFAFILTSVWTLLALFAATLSERPYPHYLLQAAAPSAILLGIFFAGKGLVQPLTVIPLLLACLVPVYYKYWYYSTPAYYQRFLNFATGLSSREGYFSQFNQNVLEDYQIANFLVSSSKPSDRAFVWGPDSPVIYALSRRLPPIKFTADYHIKDFSSQKTVAILLSQNRPKFIVLTLQATPFPEINPLLKKEYLPISRMNGTEIWIKSR